jgi:hypothetical protein
MTGASTISKNRCHGSRPPYQARLDQAAAFTALVSAAGVDDSDLPFFAEDLFPLAGAGRAFAGLVSFAKTSSRRQMPHIGLI